MSNKQKSQTSSKIEETSDVYLVPYQMAQEIYLDMLTDEDLPANERVSKAVANRLSLSIAEITVRPMHDIDECIYIALRIRGSKQDIEKVDNVLKARDESIEKTERR